MRYALALAAIVVAAAPAVAAAASGTLHYQDSIRKHSSTSVSVTVHEPAPFNVLLRTTTQGRTRLYLRGVHAPKGGPMIDTKTHACDGAAGSLYCKGSYEALPPGTYSFRIVFSGTMTNPGHVELTVKW